MSEKKKVYQAETMTLPPLRTVLGDLPEPDPGKGYRPFRAMGVKDEEARGMVKKLIRYIQEKE